MTSKPTKREQQEARIRALMNATPEFLVDELANVREAAQALKSEEEVIKNQLCRLLNVTAQPLSFSDAADDPALVKALTEGVLAESGKKRAIFGYVTQTRFSADKARAIFADQPGKLAQCEDVSIYLKVSIKNA